MKLETYELQSVIILIQRADAAQLKIIKDTVDHEVTLVDYDPVKHG